MVKPGENGQGQGEKVRKVKPWENGQATEKKTKNSSHRDKGQGLKLLVRVDAKIGSWIVNEDCSLDLIIQRDFLSKNRLLKGCQ
jgi:hypothetical protein